MEEIRKTPEQIVREQEERLRDQADLIRRLQLIALKQGDLLAASIQHATEVKAPETNGAQSGHSLAYHELLDLVAALEVRNTTLRERLATQAQSYSAEVDQVSVDIETNWRKKLGEEQYRTIKANQEIEEWKEELELEKERARVQVLELTRQAEQVLDHYAAQLAKYGSFWMMKSEPLAMALHSGYRTHGWITDKHHPNTKNRWHRRCRDCDEAMVDWDDLDDTIQNEFLYQADTVLSFFSKQFGKADPQ